MDWVDFEMDWSHPTTKKWLLGILVGFLCGTFLYNMKLHPTLVRNEHLSQQLRQAQTKLIELKQYQKYQNHFEEEAFKMNQEIQSVEQALPLEWDIAKLHQLFLETLQISKLKLKKQVLLPETKFDHYFELKINFELTGQYHQLLTFVSKIKQMPWLVNIRKLEVDNPILKQKNPELSIRIDLSVYRRRLIEIKEED